MGVFAVDTLDLADVEWSPDDSSIVVWDSLLEYKVPGYCISYSTSDDCKPCQTIHFFFALSSL